MKRRDFLRVAGMLAGASMASGVESVLSSDTNESSASRSRISFTTADLEYQTTYSSALDVLNRNVIQLPAYSAPVLIEGSSYGGIWLECAPQEALVYSATRVDVARNNHLAFFAAQRGDGQLPCWIRTGGIGFGQIQMVVPIAATAWELAQQNHDSELLEKAYRSCTLWDAWLGRYRDTRHTGLCEGFCTYDTGHDNSPRWSGIPNRCPDADARNCPPLLSMPRLCPDLSATVYGGRVALAAMARALGRNQEGDRWLEAAASIRSRILDTLYVAEDAAFYDLDAQNHFVRIRSDVISRVLGEHVVTQKRFEEIYRRQIHKESSFWPAYPLPSIALDDPQFVLPIPRNCWGGASQALTALRAPRWMEHYGKPADLAHLMQQWIGAVMREPTFLQQLDPLSGAFTPDLGGYSPTALVFLDFTWRLSGVREVQDSLKWNLRPFSQNASASFRLRLHPTGVAELSYASGKAKMTINGKTMYEVTQPVRLITTKRGAIQRAVGIREKEMRVSLKNESGNERKFLIKPDEVITFRQ